MDYPPADWCGTLRMDKGRERVYAVQLTSRPVRRPLTCHFTVELSARSHCWPCGRTYRKPCDWTDTPRLEVPPIRADPFVMIRALSENQKTCHISLGYAISLCKSSVTRNSQQSSVQLHTTRGCRITSASEAVSL